MNWAPKQQQEEEDGVDADKYSEEEGKSSQQEAEEEHKGRIDEMEKDEKVATTRRVSVIAITLSFAPLDTSHIGYQSPLPPEELNLAGGGGRGAMRGRPPSDRGGYTGRVSCGHHTV